jgi:hypothetical protein
MKGLPCASWGDRRTGAPTTAVAVARETFNHWQAPGGDRACAETAAALEQSVRRPEHHEL